MHFELIMRIAPSAAYYMLTAKCIHNGTSDTSIIRRWVDVNNSGEIIAFFFCCRFLPKDVAQPTFSITYRVIFPLLLAEGLILSFFEDKCIATMINTCAKGNKNLIRNRNVSFVRCM